MTDRLASKRIAATVAVTALAMLIGCDSSTAGKASADPTGSTPSRASSAGSTAASPPIATTSTPTAADGTNLRACRDASCQVRVSVGDRLTLAPTFRMDRMTVKAIGRDEITLALTGHNGGFTLTGRNVDSGTSCVGYRCSYQGSVTLTTRGGGSVNQITLRVSSVDSGHAILQLSLK